jgi:hypothetical protein
MMVPVFMRMVVQRQAGEGLGHHGGVQVATLAGVDLDGRRAGGADAVGVVRGLLVALDHGQRQLGVLLLQGTYGGAQQCGLARAGAGHEVERTHAMGMEMRPVLLRHLVVGAQHVLFDADGARFAQPRHRHPRRARTKVQVPGARIDHRAARCRRWMGGRCLPLAVASTHDTHRFFPF